MTKEPKWAFEFWDKNDNFTVVHLNEHGEYIETMHPNFSIGMIGPSSVEKNEILLSEVSDIPLTIGEESTSVTYRSVGKLTTPDHKTVLEVIEAAQEDGGWEAFLEEVMEEYEGFKKQAKHGRRNSLH